MIYIDITNPVPTVFIPAHGWKYEGVGLALSLKNTTDGRELAVPISSSNAAGFLVCCTLALPEGIYTGEWQYRLTGAGGYEATGLLKVYDGEWPAAVQYDNDNITIQYGG